MIQEVHLDPPAEPIVPVQGAFERLAGASGTERAVFGHANRRKNEYLAHSFHKYKAKFFPRMARALANYTVPGDGRILDPFAGSGTLLVEAALMGMDATGVDIDPLSVFIARSKVDALTVATAHFDEAASSMRDGLGGPDGQGSLLTEHVRSERFRLPEFIGSKMPDQRATVEAEVSAIRAAVHQVPVGPPRNLLFIALSHALATKVSLRWMGTGDNRFALSVAKRSVAQIMAGQVKRIHEGLAQRDELVRVDLLELDELGRVEIEAGDVRAMRFDNGVFAGITTSPPYLPASSGRETYLRSRAPSLVALGLLSEAEILNVDQSMIGSILREPNGQRSVLPDEIINLVEWMKPQRARAPKALPIAVYFHDLIASLREMGRVLTPGGRLAMVVSTEHVFYDLMSREIVRRLNMPDALSELMAQPANEIPLRLDRVVQIELPKMDFAARPASRGSYSESIVIAERI
jgi:tRNA G10  N-methylase Trm11